MKSSMMAAAALLLSFPVVFSCNNQDPAPADSMIAGLNLKKGAVIACGPADQQLGVLSFAISGVQGVQKDFELGLKLLHSFEYDEAEKLFAAIINQDPRCAMAYWGVAMSNFHALWTPPSAAELKKGAQAIAIASSIKRKSVRESDYINAIAAFYKDYGQTDHRFRCLQFEQAMAALRNKYPGDREAAIFYALALNAAADPADKTFSRQKKAGALLEAFYREQPEHPGIVHYIIHTYDAPELAHKALGAARSYAAIAPSSAHALHMPSHIFTRLGLWDECISANLASINSAQCYAKATGLNGHWDEELHGLDYLVYAYLQSGRQQLAAQQLAYLDSIRQIEPANFKVAYACAAVPARYVLETRNWHAAANLQLPRKNFSWTAFPWQQAIIHFARALGAAHTGNDTLAQAELAQLQRLHGLLLQQKDSYKAGNVAIQVKAAEAWLLLLRGDSSAALAAAHQAASMEDNTEKHPVTPGEVIPAKELLADLLLQLRRWPEALEAYEANLAKHPNRLNGLYGAGFAAERAGNHNKAAAYYTQLLAVTSQATADRPELKAAKRFLEKHRVGR